MLSKLAGSKWCRRLSTLLLLKEILAAAAILGFMATSASSIDDTKLKGIGIKPTGLTPVYPPDYTCSKLTSLYASWTDVDGSRRTEPHSGVDGGELGEEIYAPAAGIVQAVWKTDFGWGPEGSLLILHRREDLNLSSGVPFYYSEFDHLRLEDIDALAAGQKIKRGQVIGLVNRPGNNPRFLPEVHWEIYEVGDPSEIEWVKKPSGAKYFLNETAELIDPLFMLAQHHGGPHNSLVEIRPFSIAEDYSGFKGFTYILPCRKNL